MFGFWFLDYNLNIWKVTARLCALVLAVIVFLPLHEIIHIKIAKKFLDEKCKIRDFQFFNFFDPIGAVFMLIFQYGWARRWNFYFHKPLNNRSEIVITNLSGPLFNFLSAVIIKVVVNLFALLSVYLKLNLSWVILVFYYLVEINVRLATIEFLPIPPLDGFKIIEAFIPERYMEQYFRNYFVIWIILSILLLVGFFDFPVFVLENIMHRGVDILSSLPFMFFRGLKF